MRVIDGVKAKGGNVVDFSSFCGGKFGVTVSIRIIELINAKVSLPPTPTTTPSATSSAGLLVVSCSLAEMTLVS